MRAFGRVFCWAAMFAQMFLHVFARKSLISLILHVSQVYTL